MTGITGRSFLLSIGAASTTPASDTYTLIGGCTDGTFTINNQTVDTTTKDDSGNRMLLDAKVLQSVSASGSFVLRDDATHKTLQTVATAGVLRNFRITIPGDNTIGGTYSANFHVTSLEFQGAHDGAVSISLAIESSGAVTYSATP